MVRAISKDVYRKPHLNEDPTGTSSLLRNDVKGGHHWLKVKLIGQKSNRSAIGATVIARYGERTQAQTVTSQASFYSANDSRLRFRLGQEKTADLEIRWPIGEIEEISQVASDQLVIIKEGSGVFQKQSFGSVTSDSGRG